MDYKLTVPASGFTVITKLIKKQNVPIKKSSSFTPLKFIYYDETG
jgi:hypothetical protein